MTYDSKYTSELEVLITQTLMPIYHKYHKLVNLPEPGVISPILVKLESKIPKLFKPIKK